MSIRPNRFPQRRVLVVDDDPTFTLVAGETLTKAGFLVRAASSAQSARDAFAAFQPETVLLAVGLPDGSGHAVCRWIRQSPFNAEVPVILVTTPHDEASIDQAYEAGADDFILKPVLWPTLPRRIDFVLRAFDDRRALARSEKKNRTLLQALPDSIVIVDAHGLIVEHVAGSEARGERSWIGESLEAAFPPDLAHAARRVLKTQRHGASILHEFADGEGQSRRWFEARLRPQPDGSLLIIRRDATERRRSKARIEYLAYYDPLTGLPNRQMLLAKVERAIKAAQGSDRLLAVFYIDLDRFKRVNDSLGHAEGDALLCTVARRLKQLIMPRPAHPQEAPAPGPKLVARLGGDEFVLIADGLTEESEALAIADRIRGCLAEPVDFGGRALVVTPSIGIAMYPRDASEVADLLVKADMAMYVAKDQGRNCSSFFGQSIALRSLNRFELENDMRAGFERGEFEVYYQPKVQLETGAITGVEALLRWLHPERGFVPPDKFIPVAEETGLIVPIGEWVLGTVCRQLATWNAMGLKRLTAAVNVSVQQFMRPSFVDAVLGSLRSSGLDPARLELEITESLLMRNTREMRSTLDRLRTSGITLTIDDFGTGFSSLGYLRQLPVSTLKIDRSYVHDLPRLDDAAAICAAIIALARELRLKVVAEGVESRAELDFLRSHQCEEVQGYLISRPVASVDLELLLQRGSVDLDQLQDVSGTKRSHSERNTSHGRARRRP